MSPANLLFVPEELSAYQWRPARMEDIPAVYVMRAAGVAVDRPHTPPSEERLGHLFGLLGEHLEQNTLLALAGDDAVAAAAFVFLLLFLCLPVIQHLLIFGQTYITLI